MFSPVCSRLGILTFPFLENHPDAFCPNLSLSYPLPSSVSFDLFLQMTSAEVKTQRQLVLSNITKNTQPQWLMLVIPALWEAEVRGSLEPRSSKLQWAVIAPLHSCLGNRARPCLLKGFKIFKYIYIFSKMKPGTMAHACNPSTLGGRGRQIT